MNTGWYEWLKEQIASRKFDSKVECSFMHGQIMFAYIADIITETQKDELCNSIPEY